MLEVLEEDPEEEHEASQDHNTRNGKSVKPATREKEERQHTCPTTPMTLTVQVK